MQPPTPETPQQGDPLPPGPRIDVPEAPELASPETTSNPDGIHDRLGHLCFGPTLRMYFNPKSGDCEEYDILQLSNLKVEVLDPDGEWRIDPKFSHGWDVDGPTSSKDPTNKTVRPATTQSVVKHGDFMEFSDTPGTPGDPWTNPNMAGKTLRYTGMFETYIVCLSPTYGVLGRFAWMYVMEVTIGSDSGSATYPVPTLKPSKPRWAGWNAKRGGNLKDALNAWNKKEAPNWLPK